MIPKPSLQVQAPNLAAMFPHLKAPAEIQRNGSNVIQIFLQLSGFLNLSATVKETLLALYAIAGKRPQFKISLLTLYKYLMNPQDPESIDIPEKEKEGCRQFTRNRLKKVEKFQKESRITFLSRTQDAEDYKYIFDISPLANTIFSILDSAYASSERNLGIAIEQATRQKAIKLLADATPSKKPQPPSNNPSALNQMLKFEKDLGRLEHSFFQILEQSAQEKLEPEFRLNMIDKLIEKATALVLSMSQARDLIHAQLGPDLDPPPPFPSVPDPQIQTEEVPTAVDHPDPQMIVEYTHPNTEERYGGGGVVRYIPEITYVLPDIPLDGGLSVKEAAVGQAAAMVELFGSVGADKFDFNLVEYDPNKPRDVGDNLEFDTLSTNKFLENIPRAIELNHSEYAHFFVRPRLSGSGVALLQLDDLGQQAVENLQPFGLLGLKTSGGNHQVVLAIKGVTAQELSAIKRKCEQVYGADLGANGSYRVAGSKNLKSKYAPAFPTVEIIFGNPGKIVTIAELEQVDIVVAAETHSSKLGADGAGINSPLLCSIPVAGSSFGKQMPDYAYFLGRPHLKKDGSVDLSATDYAFAATALRRGFSQEEVIAELARHRSKAAVRPDYARRTIAAAAKNLGLL